MYTRADAVLEFLMQKLTRLGLPESERCWLEALAPLLAEMQTLGLSLADDITPEDNIAWIEWRGHKSQVTPLEYAVMRNHVQLVSAKMSCEVTGVSAAIVGVFRGSARCWIWNE